MSRQIVVLAFVALGAMFTESALAQYGWSTPPYDSTNATYKGFEIVSNVTGHLTVSRDACQIRDILLNSERPLNFAASRLIYTNGSNAIRPDGIAKRALIAWTTGAHATGHPYFTNGTALFGNQSAGWLGDYMVAAHSETQDDNWSRARATMATHSAFLIPMSYALAELYAIADEIDGPVTGAPPLAGAPHALDEGFGVYVAERSECAPFSFAENGAKMFGTRATCDISKANQAILAAFNDAQAATIAGNVEEYETARDTIIRHMHIGLIQSLINAADEAEKASGMSARANKTSRVAAKSAKKQAKNLGKAGTKGDEALRLKEAAADAEMAAMSKAEDLHVATAEQYTIFRFLGPFVNMVDSAAAKSMDTLLHYAAAVSKGHAQKVQAALEALYPKFGLTQELIGTLGANSTISCPN